MTIFESFSYVFSGLGKLGTNIKFNSCQMPNHMNCIPLERYQCHMPEVQQELDRMELIEVISKVDLQMAWCAGLVVVPKKICFCVDIKSKNESVLREVHPVPKWDEMLAQMSGA